MFRTVGNGSSLSTSVGRQIEEAIRTRQISPGDKLPSELELCKQFGVSRTVVREALRTLSAKGYISIAKGKGMFVKGFTGEAVTTPLHNYLQMHFERSCVMDIVHARQIIEPSMAAMAAENHSDEDLVRIRKDIDTLKACTGDFTELARLDMLFHLDISKASQNALMPLLVEPIHRLMPNIKSSVYATVADAKDSAVTWHEKIFSAITAGKPEAARRAMTEHLQIAERHAEQMLLAQRKSMPSRPQSKNT